MTITWQVKFRREPLTEEYEQGAVDVINTYYRWMNGSPITTLEDMRGEWSEEGFNRETDTQVLISPEGKVIGYSDIYDITAHHVRMFGLLAVNPTYMDQGAGEPLVEWMIERAKNNVAIAPEGTRVVLHMSGNSTSQYTRQVLESFGFHIVRASYRMIVELDQPPAAPEWPAGITIRPMTYGQEEQEVVRAVLDSFQDHWGYVNEPFEEAYKSWQHYMSTDPIFDPSLWFVALEGDRIAGVSLCSYKTHEDEHTGWVQTLGVRREWRKQGLGLALLRHSFRQLYDRGQRRVGLGVDASNLTGATRLYEKAGMRVHRKNFTYELELRAGNDLMRQNL